ncbi:MAG: DUF5011 domain-containing protein, partial [Campylobacterales bacterium]|nr:DUF5011 domain-containing protein [Campylobacterales bacterium]
MAYKNIVLSICTVSTALMLSACGGGSSSEKEVTSVFEDALVQNLPYTCSPSNKSGQTNQNGEFTCNEGDQVSFQLGSTILGPIEAKANDPVTPYKLFPKDEQKAIRLAQLLLSLDDDGNYDEFITLDLNKLKEIITENIDFGSTTFEEDVQALLDKDNLALVNAATAKNHLHASDTEPPVVTLLGESTVTINVTANSTTDYMDAGATAYDAFEGALEVKRTGTVNTTVAGTYHYTYTATDKAGNSASAIRTIIVKAVDTTPPVITLNGANPMSVNKGAAFVDPGASATDDVDGSVDVKVSGTVNTNTVGTYTLT